MNGWKTLAATLALALPATCASTVSAPAAETAATAPERLAPVVDRDIGAAEIGEPVIVTVDRARVFRVSRPAATVIVGNPSIADVSVQSGDTLVLTGKSFGETNLIVMDTHGQLLVNRRVVVQEPDGGFVTVFRGVKRETLHCSPNCETQLVIGDTPTYFDPLAKEIQTKQRIGQSSAEGQVSGE